MENELKSIVKKKYLLQKFTGKGGWTFAEIPEIPQNKSNPFGWVKVRGFIDQVEIKNYHLMPMGNGKLFLPVKAEIRKKINKNEGDWIEVELFEDNLPLEIPDELMICLKEDSFVYENFLKYTESEKKQFIDWIYSAKKEETKISRIVIMMDAVLRNNKFIDKGKK
jgi:hypothetical protein